MYVQIFSELYKSDSLHKAWSKGHLPYVQWSFFSRYFETEDHIEVRYSHEVHDEQIMEASAGSFELNFLSFSFIYFMIFDHIHPYHSNTNKVVNVYFQNP